MVSPFTCPICLDLVACVRAASCGHIFCGDCCYRMLEHGGGQCAVCRAMMTSPPHPVYALDEFLGVARLEESKRRLETFENSLKGEKFLVADLYNSHAMVRYVTLKRVHRIVRTSAFCSHILVLLRAVVQSSSLARHTYELELIWLILLHCSSFADSKVLVSIGAPEALALAFMSPLASSGVHKSLCLFADALAPEAPYCFGMLLLEPVVSRVARHGAASLARLALQVPNGIDLLVQHGIVSPVLVAAVESDPVLAADFVDKVVSEPSHIPHALEAVRWMCSNHAVCVPFLATFALHSVDVARIVDDQQVLGMLVSAYERGDLVALSSVLDLLRALGEHTDRDITDAVVTCCVWAAAPVAGDPRSAEMLEFVASNAGASPRCAKRVYEAFRDFWGLCSRETNGYQLASAVFSHEEMAASHAETVASVVQQLDFSVDNSSVFFLSSLVSTPSGLRVVMDHPSVLDNLALCCRCMGEVEIAIACDIFTECARSDLGLVLRSVRLGASCEHVEFRRLHQALTNICITLP